MASNTLEHCSVTWLNSLGFNVRETGSTITGRGGSLSRRLFSFITSCSFFALKAIVALLFRFVEITSTEDGSLHASAPATARTPCERIFSRFHVFWRAEEEKYQVPRQPEGAGKEQNASRIFSSCSPILFALGLPTVQINLNSFPMGQSANAKYRNQIYQASQKPRAPCTPGCRVDGECT